MDSRRLGPMKATDMGPIASLAVSAAATSRTRPIATPMENKKYLPNPRNIVPLVLGMACPVAGRAIARLTCVFFDATSVCGGAKLVHGSGGIRPAAGGVKLCHL